MAQRSKFPLKSSASEVKAIPPVDSKSDSEKLRKYVAGTDAYPESDPRYVKGADQFSPYRLFFESMSCGPVILGREADTASYRQPINYYENYQGEVSNCEIEGVQWSLDLNRATWLGGMESIADIEHGVAVGREFRFVSTLTAICKRAERGVQAYKSGRGDCTLGGAFPEVFWLLDNDYRLVYRRSIDEKTPAGIYAIPPATRTKEIFINPHYEKYCLTDRPQTSTPYNIKQIEEMIVRLKELCKKFEPQAFSSYSPRYTLGGPPRNLRNRSSSSATLSDDSSNIAAMTEGLTIIDSSSSSMTSPPLASPAVDDGWRSRLKSQSDFSPPPSPSLSSNPSSSPSSNPWRRDSDDVKGSTSSVSSSFGSSAGVRRDGGSPVFGRSNSISNRSGSPVFGSTSSSSSRSGSPVFGSTSSTPSSSRSPTTSLRRVSNFAPISPPSFGSTGSASSRPSSPATLGSDGGSGPMSPVLMRKNSTSSSSSSPATPGSDGDSRPMSPMSMRTNSMSSSSSSTATLRRDRSSSFSRGFTPRNNSMSSPSTPSRSLGLWRPLAVDADVDAGKVTPSTPTVTPAKK